MIGLLCGSTLLSGAISSWYQLHLNTLSLCLSYQELSALSILLHHKLDVLHEPRLTQPLDGQQFFDVDTVHIQVQPQGVEFHHLTEK